MNRNGVIGSIVRIRRHHAHALNDAHTGINATEYGVLAIQPGRRLDRNEELRTVGIGRPGIRHGQYSRTRVFEVARNFVFELARVDGFSAPSRAGGIAALNHKVPNDAVKYGVVVVPSVGERGNIVAGPRCVLVIQFHAKGSLNSLRCVAFVLIMFR